jgi:hypothetical protein
MLHLGPTRTAPGKIADVTVGLRKRSSLESVFEQVRLRELVLAWVREEVAHRMTSRQGRLHDGAAPDGW